MDKIIKTETAKAIIKDFFAECYPDMLKPGKGKGIEQFSPYEILCETLEAPEVWEANRKKASNG